MELTTATLRVYVDTVDSISDEEASALSETAYNDVTAVLNEGTYFTASNGKKMYDLEVHVYNNVDKSGSEDYVYVIRAKNSSMEQARRRSLQNRWMPIWPSSARGTGRKAESSGAKDDDDEVVGGEDTEAQDDTKE